MCHRLAFKDCGDPVAGPLRGAKYAAVRWGVPGGENRPCFQSHEASAHFASVMPLW
jgi:hypothetical protein